MPIFLFYLFLFPLLSTSHTILPRALSFSLILPISIPSPLCNFFFLPTILTLFFPLYSSPLSFPNIFVLIYLPFLPLFSFYTPMPSSSLFSLCIFSLIIYPGVLLSTPSNHLRYFFLIFSTSSLSFQPSLPYTLSLSILVYRTTTVFFPNPLLTFFFLSAKLVSLLLPLS